MSTELKVCHISDVHLGYRKYSKVTKAGFNQRELDVNAAFRESIDRIIRIAPNLVLVAGDLFHSIRPSNAILTFCFRELKRLVAAVKCPVVIIAGNHETPKRSDSGCVLRLFSEIEGVYVADSSVAVLTFPELKTSVCAAPHASLLSDPQYRFRADDSSKFNILCTHAQIGTEWVSEFGGATVDLSRFSPNEWDYIALGHVHVAKQVAPNAWYSGAIEHTANNIWAEGYQNKGFLEISLPSRKVTFHELTSPRELIVVEGFDANGVEPDEIAQLIAEKLSNVPGGVEGKIVRLEVDNVTREVARAIDKRSFKSFKASALHLALELRPPVAKTVSSGISLSKNKSLDTLLKEYLNTSRGNDSNLTADLIALFERYAKKLEEGDEAPAT